MSQKQVTFNKAKKKREELQLPILHFVVSDDWIDKLGYDAFCSWLKFYSWCDRSDNRSNQDNDVIPTSFTKIMKRLGIGRKKFYNNVIRPLWNYGLIDIVEYEKSINEGQKPMNIIVYEYPQNDIKKKHEPLEKIRNYDTDYESNARVEILKRIEKAKENEQLKIKNMGLPPVSQGNTPLFREETPPCFTGKHNNVSNGITNVSNGSINDSKNLSIMERDITYLDVPMNIQKQMIQNMDRLIDDSISILDIQHLYKAFESKVNQYEFGLILGNVLESTKGKIKNIKHVVMTSINNHLKEPQQAQNNSNDAEVSQEIVPDWFKNRNREKESNYQTDYSQYDFNKGNDLTDEQKEIELLLHKYGGGESNV